MENIWSIIISAIVSGLFATLVTIYFNSRRENKRDKKEILGILLSYRYDITNVVNVNAMNRIQIVFYDNDDVINAWIEFNDAASDPSKENQIGDKYLKLIENIAKVSGYKKLSWDNIKKYYFPKGLSNRLFQENAIRSETLKKIVGSETNIDKNTQIGMTIISELLKQPDGIDRLKELVKLINENNAFNSKK